MRQRQPWRLWQLWWVGRLWRLVLFCRILDHRLVRPLLGTAAALALIIGGAMLFEFHDPAPNPQWRVCTQPIIKPPPADPSCQGNLPPEPKR
ncbi:hypothetical protein ACFYO1_33095 [Nocardia sp. NPDC006044]|uniref:hypothetical protein n=1 Tax=Nocardia sp. NPDC006044 TaxID=3364306 RepID=UPI0036C20F45